MKILILGSLNSHAGKMAPFITEQAEALQSADCEVVYFGVRGKGVVGYLKQLPRLRRLIRLSIRRWQVVCSIFIKLCYLCAGSERYFRRSYLFAQDKNRLSWANFVCLVL